MRKRWLIVVAVLITVVAITVTYTLYNADLDGDTDRFSRTIRNRGTIVRDEPEENGELEVGKLPGSWQLVAA